MPSRTCDRGVPPIAVRQKPGLSRTLTEPRDIRHCQSCGLAGFEDALDTGVGLPLRRWIECNAWDQHDDRSPVVVLCPKCEDRLIEAHPRLYVPLALNEPWTGAMEICHQCAHRRGLGCTHADAKRNGGTGLAVEVAAPTVMHICGTRRGRRFCDFLRTWPSAPTECSGRSVVRLET